MSATLIFETVVAIKEGRSCWGTAWLIKRCNICLLELRTRDGSEVLFVLPGGEGKDGSLVTVVHGASVYAAGIDEHRRRSAFDGTEVHIEEWARCGFWGTRSIGLSVTITSAW